MTSFSVLYLLPVMTFAIVLAVAFADLHNTRSAIRVEDRRSRRNR